METSFPLPCTLASREGQSAEPDLFMTGGGYRLLASANVGELVLGCINADVCNRIIAKILIFQY